MELSLPQLWRETGARLAVVGGAGTALGGLLARLPLHAAALRGTLVLFAVLGVTRLVAAGLERNERARKQSGASRG